MKTILIVEDTSAIRMGISKLLSLEGYRTVEAEDGAEGLEKARQYLPDLIICDIMMPRMDGYSVLEALKKDPVTQTIPFIFLTAKTSRKDMRQGMDGGADDFISKPFSADELVNAVQSRLEKQIAIKKRIKDLQSNISRALPHELRTPLTVLHGYAEFLEHNYQLIDRERLRGIAGDMVKSTRRLFKLIEKFLVYVQIEKLASDPVRIRELNNDSVEYPGDIVQNIAQTKAEAYERTADLKLELDNEPIRISESKLAQALNELIDNAFKFSKKETPVTITAGTDGDFYQISITNLGKGMSAEQIAEIEAFIQFDRDISEQQGLGLGLTIARRLMEIYGGQMRIESIPDEKTTIRLSIYRR